ncbi:hypothetical protein B0H17DRAFT_552795 [Mycena rosella]|uniref:F-box domain-containing protein n=1 Tax=Mycena rosella TaxID=1033263 RepID=A0AAD7BQK9_MYCRO|nr:hypothetical protein B0H17DRAFT_552795 [Mycena rosella]
MAEFEGLQGLVEDVLIRILAHCDVLNVLAIGATSKYFHHLAFSRNVWLTLVTKLAQWRFIDRRPDENMYDLSTEQLVDQVKRALHGPKTWSPPSRESRHLLQKGVDSLVWKSPATSNPTPLPVESRCIILHLDVPRDPWGPGIPFCMSEPKLLQGENYILQHWGTLECWNVFEDKLVWKHTCSMDNATVLMFAAELTDDDKLVILTCQHTWDHARTNFVEVTTLDLLTGFTSLVLVSRLPNSPQADPYRSCAVRGHIAAVELDGQVTLINWRTSSCVAILTGNSLSHIALAANCLVLTLLSPRGELQLACSPLPSPVSWAPIDSVRASSSRITVKDLPIIFADTISLNGRTFTRGEPFLAVHESPVDPGRFRVWLHLESDQMGILSSYEFVARETAVSWHRRSSVPVSSNIGPAGVSFSGHVLSWRSEIFPPVPLVKEATAPCIPLETGGGLVHLSPYSGAVTYSTVKSLDVVYYD